MSQPTSRLRFLAATAFAAAASALGGTKLAAQTYEEAERGQKNGSASNAGPENGPLTGENPNVFVPPPTDHGLPQNFWQSFSASHRRIQDGGWSRQVNVKDFPISQDIAAVNMRLEAGGTRELHWHAADEWSLMLSGSCRLTAIDLQGRPYVKDVNAGDLWYFPAGIPHSLQGIGENGCEFLLVFDDGEFSEEDTTLISDWIKHVPRDVVARNWGVPQSSIDDALSKLPESGHYIFPIGLPPALTADRSAASNGRIATPTAFDFAMLAMPPTKKSNGGEVRIVDSTNFAVSKNIAAAHVRIKPGGLRELHWHPDANEWQYWISGQGRMTVFYNASEARTADFHPGDVGYVKKTLGHYIQNTGTEDLVYLEMFKSSKYEDVSLNDWMTHIPPELVRKHLGISDDVLRAIPKLNAGVLPP